MFNFIHNFWFIQSIGVVALIFSILAWNARTRKNILYLQGVNVGLFIFQYILLGAYTGAVVQCITLSRNLVFAKKGEKKWADNPLWPFIFMALAIITLVIFWQGWVSIFPVIGVIIGTYGMSKDQPKTMRRYILSTALVWIPYDLLVHSYSGFVNDIISYVALIIGMYRHDREKTIKQN